MTGSVLPESYRRGVLQLQCVPFHDATGWYSQPDYKHRKAPSEGV